MSKSHDGPYNNYLVYSNVDFAASNNATRRLLSLHCARNRPASQMLCDSHFCASVHWQDHVNLCDWSFWLSFLVMSSFVAFNRKGNRCKLGCKILYHISTKTRWCICQMTGIGHDLRSHVEYSCKEFARHMQKMPLFVHTYYGNKLWMIRLPGWLSAFFTCIKTEASSYTLQTSVGKGTWSCQSTCAKVITLCICRKEGRKEGRA